MKCKLALFVVLISSVSLRLFAADYSAYDMTLKNIVENGFFTEKEMFSPEWNSLSQLLSSDVTARHFEKQSNIEMLLQLGGINIHSKRNTAKEMARITNRKTGFKAVTDLLAFRVQANTQGDIADNLEKLQKIANEQNGSMILKPLWQEKPDIIRFALIYFPTENVIVEIQVGHEVALITFAQDTMFDRNPQERNSCTDLWDKKFYSDLVPAILSGKTEKDLRARFLEIIKGKEEENEKNSIRNTVLSVIDGIKYEASNL